MRKIRFNDITFYIAYFLLLCSFLLSNVNFISPYLKYFKYTYFLIILFNILLQNTKFNIKSFIIITLTIVLSVLGLVVTKNNSIFIFLLFLIPFKNIDFKDFLKKDFVIRISILIFVLLMYYMNYTDNYIMYRGDGVIRNSMGFSHPNTLASIIMVLVLEVYLLFYEKHRLMANILFLLSVTFIYYVTDSRTNVLILLIFYILHFVLKICPKFIELKIVKKILKNAFIILFFISIYCTILYINGNKLMIKLDTLLTGRLYWCAVFYQLYPINLFGHSINIVGTRLAKSSGADMLILDNGYLNVLYFYGVFGVLFYSFVFNKIMAHSLKEKKITLLLIVFIMLLYGITENSFYKFFINPFLFYFAEYIKNIFKKK